MGVRYGVPTYVLLPSCIPVIRTIEALLYNPAHNTERYLKPTGEELLLDEAEETEHADWSIADIWMSLL